MRHIYLILLSVMWFTNTAAADSFGSKQFSSGIEQNSLIELYTSEGCSSCPPAEKYLNSFKSHNELWEKYIPVAFHVDYWNYLGWQDRYAHPDFSQRQSLYAKYRNLKTVYTPAFVVNGQSWRKNLFFNQTPDASNKQTGILNVTLNDAQLMADFKTINPKSETLILNIAVLGMNLTTEIKAGENEGNHAEHEFVVIGFKTVSSTDAHWNTALPELYYDNVQIYALAVWVSRQGELTPLQAVGGNL